MHGVAGDGNASDIGGNQAPSIVIGVGEQAQSEIGQHVSSLTSLNLLQRVLLSTDGTVTHVLEAYAREPIEVFKLFHETHPAAGDDPWLEVKAGETLLRRRILLRGQETATNFLFAESLFVLDRLRPAVRDGLFDTVKPIGRLLAENRVETFREIFTFGQEPAGECAAYFGMSGDEDVLFRSYRIIAGGNPIVLVTERFPATAFTDVEPESGLGAGPILR